MKWFSLLARRDADGLSSQAMEPPVESPPEASIPRVAPTSPARILAKSLTDPETRDEWAREPKSGYHSYSTNYTNKTRDIIVSSIYSYSLGLYCSSRKYLSTPFTLNKTEEQIVRDALEAFDKHLRDERERAALARLVASGTRPRENAKRSRAKPRGPTRKGDAK